MSVCRSLGNHTRTVAELVGAVSWIPGHTQKNIPSSKCWSSEGSRLDCIGRYSRCRTASRRSRSEVTEVMVNTRRYRRPANPRVGERWNLWTRANLPHLLTKFTEHEDLRWFRMRSITYLPIIDSESITYLPIIDSESITYLPIIDSESITYLPIINSESISYLPMINSKSITFLPIIDSESITYLPIIDSKSISYLPLTARRSEASQLSN